MAPLPRAMRVGHIAAVSARIWVFVKRSCDDGGGDEDRQRKVEIHPLAGGEAGEDKHENQKCGNRIHVRCSS